MHRQFCHCFIDVGRTSRPFEGSVGKVRAAGLTIRAKKCTLAAVSCVFLGHQVGGGCIRPLEMKSLAVQNFARPQMKQDVFILMPHREFVQTVLQVQYI